jgi:hypothetical protein
MYGLPRDVDLQFLTGRELIQVAIGKWQIQFNFERDASIAVESRIRIQIYGQKAEWRSGETAGIELALCLVGSTVTQVRAQHDGTLILRFGEGKELQVLDSNENLESYQITTPTGSLIV